jgi:transcriptional regulator with XRE-family HTH domain
MMSVARAVGKCQNQVPYSCAIGMYCQAYTNDRDLWFRRKMPCASGRKRPPVPEVRSPTLRRRELGALLRKRRQELGLTVEQVAERLEFSPSKVSRLETGQRGATARDVRDFCDLYGVGEDGERERLVNLAREGKQQGGWWQSYDLDFSTYVDLEAAAVSTKYFLSVVIPGLLQTADYARAMHEAWVPEMSPERIDELVRVRLMRQELLRREEPLTISAIFDEAALHRVVGGPSTMRSQLQQLIELAQLPNVTIQIIPYTVGAHLAMESTFRMLEFDDPARDVVFVEGLVGRIYLERPQDVARYSKVFERLTEIALSPQESIELMVQIDADYKNASV